MLATLLDGLTFPEGPRWHDGRLWFSDFYTQRVVAVDLAGRAETMVEVPPRPSGLGWTPDGALLVVSMLDRRVLRVENGTTRVLADLSAVATGPCNDMVVDGRGRAYVGNFGYDRHKGEPPRTTCLARVDPDGRVTPAAEDLFFPNGTVITPDGRTLIIGESFGARFTAFDIQPDGSLTNKKLVCSFGSDGMTLDDHGNLYMSVGSRPSGVTVVDTKTGKQIGFIPVPEGPANMCFAGKDRQTLYITARTGFYCIPTNVKGANPGK